MQEKRSKEAPSIKPPTGQATTVPIQHWEDLVQRDIDSVCANSLAKKQGPGEVRLPFLNIELLVDIQNRCIYRVDGDNRQKVEETLLELVCILYLLKAGPERPNQDMVSVKELKTAHFFTGPHELKIRPLLDRYGDDQESFTISAERLGGETMEMADAAYRFVVFPKIPMYYLLWVGDEEFSSRLSVLFDRSIEQHLAPDAIWGLVNLLSQFLLKGDA